MRAAYQDFIARPPTGPELDTLVSFLTSGGSRNAIVTRFSTDTLGRPAESGGKAF